MLRTGTISTAGFLLRGRMTRTSIGCRTVVAEFPPRLIDCWWFAGRGREFRTPLRRRTSALRLMVERTSRPTSHPRHRFLEFARLLNHLLHLGKLVEHCV